MANSIPYFLENNRYLLTYAGDLSNLKEVENHSRYNFVKANICDRTLIEVLFKKYNLTGFTHNDKDLNIN